MAKYVYPAIFEKEDQAYNVTFPDFPECYTSGENLNDAIRMAEDALNMTVVYYEDTKKNIPHSSDIKAIRTTDNSIATLIAIDTFEYRKATMNKAIKKTLTIPEWLNNEAIERNINFSQVLQEALKEKLGLL